MISAENPSPSPYRSDSLSNTRSPSRSASSYASGSSSPRLTFTATWNASSISRSMSCVERFAGRRSRPSARNGGRFSMLACHSCTANDSERASCVQPFLSSFNRMSAPRSVALNRSVQPSLLRQVIRYPTTWSGESKDPFATPLHRRGSMLKPSRRTRRMNSSSLRDAFAHASTIRPTCCFGIVSAATVAIRRTRSSLSSACQGSGPS